MLKFNIITGSFTFVLGLCYIVLGSTETFKINSELQKAINFYLAKGTCLYVCSENTNSSFNISTYKNFLGTEFELNREGCNKAFEIIGKLEKTKKEELTKNNFKEEEEVAIKMKSIIDRKATKLNSKINDLLDRQFYNWIRFDRFFGLFLTVAGVYIFFERK